MDAEYESYQSIHAGDRSEKCLCDVMAVVLSFTPARQLKESDWMMTVSLVDESIAPSNVEDEPQPVTINIFGVGKHHFPHVRLAGDVIRMHRLEVKKHRGSVQLTGLKQSSFVVCRKEEQSEGVWEWTYVASQNTETTESEKKEMERLWLWGQERQVRGINLLNDESIGIRDHVIVSHIAFEHGSVTSRPCEANTSVHYRICMSHKRLRHSHLDLRATFLL